MHNYLKSEINIIKLINFLKHPFFITIMSHLFTNQLLLISLKIGFSNVLQIGCHPAF